MNYIGFLKEFDPNIPNAISFEEMLMPDTRNLEYDELIINYIENGKNICGAMSFIYDNDNKPIGNLNYNTDGFFIWPSYYAYYIRKYKNVCIDKNLIFHILNRGPKFLPLSNSKLIEIEDEFLSYWVKKK